jgi:ribose transport system substrate-binding protein
LAAKAAKIPVYFAWEWGKPKYVAMVITATAAAQQTNLMLQQMGYKGSVLAFSLPAGDNCTNYTDIFESIVKRYPKVKVTVHPSPPTGWEADATAATSAWLEAHPAGSGPLAIWGCFDGPNIGAVSALASAHRTDVKIYGDNGANNAIALIAQGKYTATYWFNATGMGATLVDQAHTNASIPYSAIKPVYLDYPPTLIDQANAQAFIKAHPAWMKGA